MDIGICFWSQEAKQVEVRYWYSQFLRRAISGDLLENFNKSLVGLDLLKNHSNFNALSQCKLVFL